MNPTSKIAAIVAADQHAIIQEGIPTTELIKIDSSETLTLTSEERQALQVKKNKIFNSVTLENQWDTNSYKEFIRKVNKIKLMMLIIAKPDRFHPYPITKFFKRAKVAADGKS